MISLLLTIVIIALIGYVAIWVLGQLAPGHPGLIDRIIWVIVVVACLLIALQAFGIVGPAVPRLR